MRGFIAIIGIIFIAATVILFSFNYSVESHKKEGVVTAMLESAQIAVVEGQDHSSRVDEQKSFISESDFELSFEKALNKNLNIDIGINDITYRYFKINDGDFKAIDISLVSDTGENFKTTFRKNLSEME